MLDNSDIAGEVSNLMLGINDRLEESLNLVRTNCSHEEAVVFGMAVGRIVNMIFEGILEPIYLRHPQITPPGLE